MSWIRVLTWGLVLLLTGCGDGPEPIRWGVDTCDLCRMTLTDRYFGAELLADDGRVYKFDGLDELARFQEQKRIPGRAFVTDGISGELIPAETAIYVSSPALKGPMGAQTVGFTSRAQAERFVKTSKLHALTWPTYSQALARELARPRVGGNHAHH